MADQEEHSETMGDQEIYTMDLGGFLNRLKIVPSFFTLDNVNFCKLKTVLSKIEDPEEYKYIDFVNDNLASFLCFIFEDVSGCKKKYKVTLKKKPENIQANVMKCAFYFKTGQMTEAEECFRKLEKFSKDGFLMAEARSELAYAFSRMGSRYYPTAIALYGEAIAKYPLAYGWKYRQALSLRRCLHPSVVTFLPVETNQVEDFHKCEDLLEDVIHNSDDQHLRALCYVTLSRLYVGQTTVAIVFAELNLTEDDRKAKTMEFLQKAEECEAEREKVLTETGRVLRHMGEFDKSRDVLVKAVAIRETADNCAQLAFTLRKLDGCVDSAIYYLKKSVDISQALNIERVDNLGCTYMMQSPPNYDEALNCFEMLINDCSYAWKRNGYERASKCYIKLSSQERKEEYSKNINKCRTQCIVNAALECLQQPPNLKEEKIPVRELFSGTLEAKPESINSYYEYKRVVIHFKKNLNFRKDIQNALRSYDVDDALRKLAYDLLDSKKYDDCLDLTTMLLMTTIPHIEEDAVDIMMKIVGETSHMPNDLAKTCFTRATDGLCSVEEGAAHVRIIYDVNSSKDEFELLEEWLSSVDLKIAKNDEEVLCYLDRQEALVSALSSNIVIICLFKDNTTNLLEDYPINSLPLNKPVIIPVRVDKSAVAPVVDEHQFMDFPGSDVSPRARAAWLKEFGYKLFSEVVKVNDYI